MSVAAANNNVIGNPANAIDPIANPRAWDVIGLGNLTSPGICRISGFKRKNKWDFKDGKGQVGTTPTLVGVPAIRNGTITFSLWTSQHFADWLTFAALFQYQPAGPSQVTAIDIYHPSFVYIGLTSVVCDDISPPEYKGGGIWEIVVTMSEYKPAVQKAAVATPIYSAPLLEPAGPAYVSPAEQELQNTLSIAQALSSAGNTP